MRNMEIGVIRRSKNKAYATAKDPEASLVDIKKLLMKHGIDPDKIQTRINYSIGQIMVIFEVKIPKETGNIPMVLLFKPISRRKRSRQNGRMIQVFDLASAARQLYHKLQNKLRDVADGYSTEQEEFLSYIVLSGTGGATLLDKLAPTIDSGELRLGSLHEALALPAPDERPHAESTGPIIEAEIVSQ